MLHLARPGQSTRFTHVRSSDVLTGCNLVLYKFHIVELQKFLSPTRTHTFCTLSVIFGTQMSNTHPHTHTRTAQWETKLDTKKTPLTHQNINKTECLFWQFEVWFSCSPAVILEKEAASICSSVLHFKVRQSSITGETRTLFINSIYERLKGIFQRRWHFTLTQTF